MPNRKISHHPEGPWLKFRASLRPFSFCLAILFGIGSVISADAADKYTIAIATKMSHPALDAVQQGVITELASEGFVEGGNVNYILRNASGQDQLVPSIANELAARNPNVIVAITTPMAQAVVKVSKVPVVFAAVTDPVSAGLVSSLDVAEPNVTGTSDAWPYEDQLKLIREITPNASRIGVLYNPGEAASQYGIKQIRKYAGMLGFSLVEAAVSSTNDVFPVARNLMGRVDALFLSSDNTVIAGMAGALQVSIQNHVPLYVGDSGTVRQGGLAAVSVGYLALGRETGKLVARVLRGERDIPTVVAEGNKIYVNVRAAKLMGVKIPDTVVKRAAHVFDSIE